MAASTASLTMGTIVTYISGIPLSNVSQQMSDNLDAKAAQMTAENKTDGLYQANYALGTVERHWLDSAAANEWKTYVEDQAQIYAVGIEPINIFPL